MDKNEKKTWDNFWASGKVTDYLSYRNSINDNSCGANQQQSFYGAKEADKGRSDKWDNPLW